MGRQLLVEIVLAGLASTCVKYAFDNNRRLEGSLILTLALIWFLLSAVSIVRDFVQLILSYPGPVALGLVALVLCFLKFGPAIVKLADKLKGDIRATGTLPGVGNGDVRKPRAFALRNSVAALAIAFFLLPKTIPTSRWFGAALGSLCFLLITLGAVAIFVSGGFDPIVAQIVSNASFFPAQNTTIVRKDTPVQSKQRYEVDLDPRMLSLRPPNVSEPDTLELPAVIASADSIFGSPPQSISSRSSLTVPQPKKIATLRILAGTPLNEKLEAILPPEIRWFDDWNSFVASSSRNKAL